jgi:hypothetical protein
MFAQRANPRFTARRSVGETSDMGRVLKEASFEEWIEFVFARPVTDPAWHWEAEADRWEGTHGRTLELVAETFERCAEVLETFDDDQVAQGLSLLGSMHGDMGPSWVDEAIPRPLQARALESIFVLFRDCFAVRCSNHLGDLGEPDANPINLPCYMWWDNFPAVPEPDRKARRKRDDLILSVMGRTLELPSEACQEAALHGLGHWHSGYPEQIEAMIDRFIWANRKIRTPLRNYAYAARHGDVQ